MGAGDKHVGTRGQPSTRFSLFKVFKVNYFRATRSSDLDTRRAPEGNKPDPRRLVTNLESHTHFSGHQLLHGGEHNWVADLFPFAIPFNLSIKSRGLPGFGMGVIGANGVHLSHRYQDMSRSPYPHLLYKSLKRSLDQVTALLAPRTSPLPHLDICAISRHEFLINVGSSFPYAALG